MAQNKFEKHAKELIALRGAHSKNYESENRKAQLIRGLAGHGGWAMYRMDKLERYFKLIDKLEKSSKDSDFYNLRGQIREIEFDLNRIENIISEGGQT